MDDILTWLKKHKVITFIIAFAGVLWSVDCSCMHSSNIILSIPFGLLNGQLAMLSAILLDLKRWLEQLCWE